MALPTIFTDIERTLYEAIRIITLSEGWTPDITIYPNDEAGTAQYKEDLAAIKVAKGFAIEIFNNTQPEQKGMIETPRICIMHGGTPMGHIGLPVQHEYETNGGAFIPTRGTTMTNEYTYEVYLTTRDLIEFRVCQGILMQALPSRSWIDLYGAPEGERVLNQMVSGYSSSGELKGTKEFVYAYIIPDLILSIDKEEDPIPKMVTYNLEISHYLGIT